MKKLYASFLVLLLASCKEETQHINSQQVNFPDEVMQSSPALPSEQVTLYNWDNLAYIKWSVVNISALMKTQNISRDGNITSFITQHRENTVESTGIQDHSFNKIIRDADVDGMIIAQNNKVVYEKYFNPFMDKNSKHTWFSMTKSLISTIAGILVDEGKLNLEAKASTYVPELKGSVYENVSIQNILNMSVGAEIKTDSNLYSSWPESEEAFNNYDLTDFGTLYLSTLGVFPMEYNASPFDTDYYSVDDALRNIKASQDTLPGEKFEYLTANEEVMEWIITRICKKPIEKVISEKLWSKIGSEHDAYLWVDRSGVSVGSISSTLRDLLRFGLVISNHGYYNNQQIVPSSWVSEIFNISDKDRKKMEESDYKITDEAYHNFWWILDSKKNIVLGKGIHGQLLYLNFEKNVVIALFGSAVEIENKDNSATKDLILLLDEIANTL